MAERSLKSIPRVRGEAPDVRERPAVAPGPASDAQGPAETKRPLLRRRQRIRWGLFGLVPIAIVLAGYWYVTGGKIMSTDDAYVDAQKVGISTDVAGIVKDVDVTDNQRVAAGQVLYHLEPRQFQIALDNAKSNLALTALNIKAMKQDYQRMLSDSAAQQATVELDQTNFDRDVMLLHSNTVPQATYDQAQSTLKSDKNKLESLRQQAQMQLARLDDNPDIPVEQHPQYLQAKAQVDEAQRELDHTTVEAPFAGIVTDVSTIAAGKYLAASATAFYLVDIDHAWIAANPKETELTYVRPGQPATVTIDAYPGVQWHGAVASVSPAAAEEFSLLPAENTSGNWVKVVQRVPMRIRIDTRDEAHPLRPGMSAEIEVNTGHARGFPHLFDW